MKIKLLVTLALLTISNCEDEEETEEERMDRINSQWAFALYDLIDFYDELSTVRRNVLLHTSSYADKISAELKYSRYLRNQSKQISQFEDGDIPSEYQRMHKMLLTPNNAALNDEDLVKLIEFANTLEEMSENYLITDPIDSTKELFKRDYEDVLETSRNGSYLKTVFSDWQSNVMSGNHNFTEILFLTKRAASSNDKYDSVKYWEDMVQYSNGYSDAKSIWEEIEPFYKKFHQFVLDRINNYYKTNYTNIPVYLSGSKFGDDWSSLADIVLPHQQIYHDAITSLSEKTKKSIYQHCSKVADTLKFKQNPDQFWKQSNFKSEFCPAKVLSFCSNEYSIMFTCNKTSWTQYLNMQEAALEVGIRNLDYSSLPYRHVQDSFLEEGIKSLGSSIAIYNLAHDELTEGDAFLNEANATENLMTAKLLMALRILPRLAYYYTADSWRINEMEYSTGDVVKSWWESRIRYQGIEGVTNEETDFLEDEHIIRNKPYLGKFLGTVLQFSVLSQLELPSEHYPSIADQLLAQSFDSMINDVTRKDPKEIISWHYSTEDLSYYDIKSYFSPLEKYFESAPLEPHPFERRKLKGKAETSRAAGSTSPIAVTEQTPKLNVNLSRKETDVVNEVVAPEDVPQNDAIPEKAGSRSMGMYVLITIAACVLIMVALLVFKRLVKRRRPQTNNRRFQA